jgi:replicative DNA helicase
MKELQPPPYNLEAEQSVLGSLLIDDKELLTLNLEPTDFYRDEHQEIFEAMLKLAKKEIPIDIISVSEELKEKGKLEFIGGESYLMQLASSMPNAVNVSYYARIVKKNSIARQMMTKGEKIFDLANSLELDEARKIAGEIVLMNENTIDKPFSETFNEEDFQRLSETKRFHSKNLQTLTFYMPFMRGENIYIAGKTSTGKTQLALNLALSFLEEGAMVGYISMEVGREQLLIRLLNWEFGKEGIRLSDIDIRKKEWWETGMALINQEKFKRFYFTEEFNKLQDIISWIESHQFDVVFIDYIQLIKAGTGKNRVEELGDIAKEFRRLSKKRCMVILSQFNRQRDEDEEDIDISRIRDSGEIEQTATGIILIRRDRQETDQFYYAIAKNQTYGTLSRWKKIELKPNGEFVEV